MASLNSAQTLAFIGPAVLAMFSLSFLGLWAAERTRVQPLLFSLAFGLYCAGAVVQIAGYPRDAGQNTMLSAVFYVASALLVVRGILMRAGRTLPVAVGVGVAAAILGAIYFFFYEQRDLAARIYVLNLGLGAFLFYGALRATALRHGKLSDRILFWVFLFFSLHFFVRTVLTMHTPPTAATIGASAFWLVLQLMLSVAGVALGLALFGSFASDLMDALREERDSDPLTGLLNRRGLEEKAGVLFGRPEQMPVSAIVCDIDRFKAINDTYGHAAGDAVLSGFGRLIAAAARSADLCARIGGEEFVVMLPNADAGGAELFAERLRGMLADLHVAPLPPGMVVTASFGIAERAPGERLWKLISRADAALYAAKRAGRNRAVVDTRRPGRAA